MDPTDPTLSRRRLLQATAGTATAAALSGRGVADARPVTAPPGTDVLRLIGNRLDSLDPVAATSDTEHEVLTQVFDTLTHFPDGETGPEPLLARSVRTDDGRRVRIELERGVRFHDGSELTADDVVYSFERLAQSDQSRYQWILLDTLGVEHRTDRDQYQPGTLAVTAESEYVVSIQLESAFHSVSELLAMPWFSILPEGIVGDVDGYSGEMRQADFARNPIGCGPFAFGHWSTMSEIVVQRWEEYHGRVPSIEAVNWRIIDDPNARYTYSVINEATHEVDVPESRYDARKVSVDRTDERGRRIGTYGPLENGKRAAYFSVPDLLTYYIGFNQANVETPVRKAVANVFNQTLIAKDLIDRSAQPAAHLTPPNLFPGNAAGYDEHAQGYPYDIDESRVNRARRIMEDAGYSESSPYELEFTVYPSSFWEELGQRLRDWLQSAHVDLTVQQTQFSTLLERGRDGNLEAYSLGWQENYPAAPDFLKLLAPGNTDTSESAPMSFLDWSGTAAAEEASAAWAHIEQQFDPGPNAYVAMERSNWKDMVLLPVAHTVTETMWYDTLDVPIHGSVGRQKYNTVTEPGADGGDDGGSGGDRSGGSEGDADYVVVVGEDGENVFSPEELTIGVGETVRFEWDSNGHSIVVDAKPTGADWNGHRSIEDRGFVHEHTFETAGRYEFYCAPHQSIGMEGVILVGEPGSDGGGDDGEPTETTDDGTVSGPDDETAPSNESDNGSAQFSDGSQEMPGFGVGSALTALAAGGAIRWLADDDE